MARKIVLAFALSILIATFASIGLATAAPYTVGTYASDLTTPQTHYALNDNVYIKWDTTGSGLSTVELELKYPGGTITYSGVTGDHYTFWDIFEDGAWTVTVKDPTTHAVLATSNFTVGTLVVTPENGLGSLIALTACFAAVGVFAARKGKKANSSHV